MTEVRSSRGRQPGVAAGAGHRRGRPGGSPSSILLCVAVVTAIGGGQLAAQHTGLTSGTYPIDTTFGTQHYMGTLRLEVSGNRISGLSEWSCCPGKRVDPVYGEISGDSVRFTRNCTGQGNAGQCDQVYEGTIKGRVVEGILIHNGARAGTWRVELGAGQTEGACTIDCNPNTVMRVRYYDGRIETYPYPIGITFMYPYFGGDTDVRAYQGLNLVFSDGKGIVLKLEEINYIELCDFEKMIKRH